MNSVLASLSTLGQLLVKSNQLPSSSLSSGPHPGNYPWEPDLFWKEKALKWGVQVSLILPAKRENHLVCVAAEDGMETTKVDRGKQISVPTAEISNQWSDWWKRLPHVSALTNTGPDSIKKRWRGFHLSATIQGIPVRSENKLDEPRTFCHWKADYVILGLNSLHQSWSSSEGAEVWDSHTLIGQTQMGHCRGHRIDEVLGLLGPSLQETWPLPHIMWPCPWPWLIRLPTNMETLIKEMWLGKLGPQHVKTIRRLTLWKSRKYE